MKLYVPKLLAGDRLALARVISKIEDRDPGVPEFMRGIFAKTGRAQVWGITGPPGAGKSTLVDQVTQQLRKENKRVAVVAVDPSSPFTGGAVLGDRIRMQNHFEDEGVYIRSLGTRGMHGGLSHSTKEVVLTLDAAGFDVILVETAGVGQTELEILKIAQSVIVVLVPESGDSIQAMKAGLMEIADVFVVNKADRPQADQFLQDLVNHLALAQKSPGTWDIPVLKTVAYKGTGIPDLVSQVHRHQEFLTKSGRRVEILERFLVAEIENILTEKLNKLVEKKMSNPKGKAMLKQLLNRKTDPYSVANKISRMI